MISTQKNFLFIHVPKTGGNSIQNILRSYSEDDIVCISSQQDGIERFDVRNSKYNTAKHSTLSDYKSELDPTLFSRLFKFATIRNPWDLVVSFYFSPHRGKNEWNREEFKRVVKSIQPLRNYVYIEPLHEKIARKLRFPIRSGNVIKHIDFLIRFENIQSDFDDVCRELGIPQQRLPKRNASNKGHYATYYDQELVDFVGQHFSEEIKIGNYAFEQPS